MKKNIRDIAPLLALHFTDYTPTAEMYDNYYDFLQTNKARLGVYAQYIHRLHDSQVHETSLENNTLTIKLDDHASEMYAEALILKKTLEQPAESLHFPVKFEFVYDEISFKSVDDDGFLTTIKPTAFHEYLYESVLGVTDTHIDLALVLWRKRPGKGGQYVVVFLKLRAIQVRELQASAWNTYFGRVFDSYYTYFASVRHTERFLATDEQCEMLIDEHDYMKQHN